VDDLKEKIIYQEIPSDWTNINGEIITNSNSVIDVISKK
jgi:hypothetical protein